MLIRVLPTLLFVLVLGGRVTADNEGLEPAVRALESATAEEVRALAAWCQKKKLYGKRDEVLVKLLELTPDDKAARKRLRFERDEAGVWVQAERYKRPRNHTRAGLEEVDEKLQGVLSEHLDNLIQLYAQPTSIPQISEARRRLTALQSRFPARSDIRPVLRQLTVRYYVAVADRALAAEVRDTAAWLRAEYGEDDEIRTLLGLETYEGKLLLKESVRTLTGASGLAKAVKAAQGVTAIKRETSSLEKSVALPWVQPVATAHVRVAGTETADHLRATAKACEGCGLLFQQALCVEPAWRQALTIYLFGAKEERGTFLDAFPVVQNPTLALREKLDLIYADGSTLLVRAILPAAQLDLAVNEVLNQLLSDSLLENRTPRAWHAEGVSRYLAWKLTGTRYAINVSGKYGAGTKDRAIPDTSADWLSAARAHLRKKPADLQLLLGKGTDVFSVRDALVAFAFSMYLIEGHPKLAGPFIKLHEETKDVDRTCRGLLGMRRAIVEQRLLRWIDEVIAHRQKDR